MGKFTRVYSAISCNTKPALLPITSFPPRRNIGSMKISFGLIAGCGALIAMSAGLVGCATGEGNQSVHLEPSSNYVVQQISPDIYRIVHRDAINEAAGANKSAPANPPDE